MSLGTKRSASPLPLHFDNIRKIKLSTSKKDKNRGHAATLLSGTRPNHGQEVVSLSPFLPQPDAHQDVNDLILRTVARLAQEGKRLTRAPQLLPDGIAFDWVSDVTARGESLKALLSVQGIRSADLDKVLSRVASRTARASTLDPPKLSDALDREVPSRSNASAPPPSHLPLGNASNPIVIDDGEEDRTEIMCTTQGTPGNAVLESIWKRPSSMNDMRRASVSPLGMASHLPPDTASPKRAIAEPSRVSGYESRTSPPPTIAEREGWVDAAAALPSTYVPYAQPSPAHSCPQQGRPTDDRASVMLYASARAERPDKTGGTEGGNYQRGDPAPSTVPSLVDDDVHSGHRRSTRDLNPPSQRQMEKRRADYGNWQGLGAESSEADMDDEPSSSRESSPDRAFPPQSLNSIPGLGFLPQTYDVSGLVSQQAFTYGPRSGSCSSSTASLEGVGRPPSKRPQAEIPRTGRDRTVRRAHGTSSGLPASDGPYDASTGRRSPLQHLRTGSHDPTEGSSEYMEVDSMNAEVQQETSNSRNSAYRGGRHRVQTGMTARRSQSKGRASSEHSQESSPAGRTPLSSSPDVESDLEEDQREPTYQPSPAGHTVVIPKADFARGRRLLTPRDQDIPFATILMRGDAHFIDQRQKSRKYSWSLPVEDESRHVEDACLIAEGTVVVGYNKGPCQVSLIPVRGDQRPRRIDLSYRAHSTVIEKRFAGTSHPNPGIACLAPVTSDSFLSGGHDKTVRHWKVTRTQGQSGNCAEFSAGSVRIPMEHSHAIQALAYSEWNNAVYSGSGERIATTRLDAPAPSESVRVSGRINQVHVHPQDPRLIALEIDHMDYQVHFYDTREGGFGRRPWLEFGYRAAPPKPRSASRPAGGHSASFKPKTGSRYYRGSAMNSLFARGYSDGVVLVWDYRNGAQKKVLERFSFQRPTEVVHTVLAGSDVIAYGGYSATFWSVLGG